MTRTARSARSFPAPGVGKTELQSARRVSLDSEQALNGADMSEHMESHRSGIDARRPDTSVTKRAAID
jgi:hypothetical protein